MKGNKKWFFLLHVLLMIYALGSVCSKYAAEQSIGSVPFTLLYGGVIVTLGIYAVGWQQIIKHLPLTTAYANKAVTVVWGVFFGVIFFQEQITLRQMFGVIITVAGVVLYIFADKGEAS